MVNKLIIRRERGGREAAGEEGREGGREREENEKRPGPSCSQAVSLSPREIPVSPLLLPP